MTGTPYQQSLDAWSASIDRPDPPVLEDPELLLHLFHPDNNSEATVELRVGVNRGLPCNRQLARLLEADSRIDEADLVGAEVHETDVLVIGSGGAGCAAALIAAQSGARVTLVTKLRMGDSNTIMAEGGLQAAIESGDMPQEHFADTMRRGHYLADPELVSQLVMDGPDVVRWLIQQGMQFDSNEFGDLLTRKAGGTSAPRLVYCRDYTGLEMIRVLREAVNHSRVEVWENSPAVELLSNESGTRCAGAVIQSLRRQRYRVVKAHAVVLATGGSGRLHINGFPTSNHFGATADGLVLAYRLGARLRELDSFQYHPTGFAYPVHVKGTLITEGVRSAGAHLLNGHGQRFIDELMPRDVVATAILRECAEGRGVTTADGSCGVWLDTPSLELRSPGILGLRFPKLIQQTRRASIDPLKVPLLVSPTLHYQNGGVTIDTEGASTVAGLYCVGEVSGGIHGRNRLMGNALLEIISFGRRAGASAAARAYGRGHKKVTLEHLRHRQRELAQAQISATEGSPILFPEYALGRSNQ